MPQCPIVGKGYFFLGFHDVLNDIEKWDLQTDWHTISRVALTNENQSLQICVWYWDGGQLCSHRRKDRQKFEKSLELQSERPCTASSWPQCWSCGPRMWEVWKCWGNHCKFWESFNNKCWTQQTSKKIFIDTDILNKLWQVGKCCWCWSQAINTQLTAPVVNIISPIIVYIQYQKNLNMIITKCRCFSLLEDKKNKFSTPRRSWRWRRTVCGRCRPLSPPPDLGSELPLWETHSMCLVRLLSTQGMCVLSTGGICVLSTGSRKHACF